MPYLPNRLGQAHAFWQEIKQTGANGEYSKRRIRIGRFLNQNIAVLRCSPAVAKSKTDVPSVPHVETAPTQNIQSTSRAFNSAGSPGIHSSPPSGMDQ